MSGRLVILSGPSGVGKDTVIDAWRLSNSNVERVIAATTRTPRPGEVDGVDYHFLSLPEFEQRASQGAFLEHKLVHGNWYATPLAELNAGLVAGKVMLLKIDVQGALSVMALRPDALTIFLMPPSDAELEKRLRSRLTETEEQIRERLKTAREEIALSNRYQHLVVNDEVVHAVQQLEDLVHG
jgi:guanylate kinase